MSTIDNRRRSLLATLFFADAGTSTVRELAVDMETVHNTPVSSDLVRADLTWLHEMGLARFSPEGTAQITGRGRDVVRKAAPWPGSI